MSWSVLSDISVNLSITKTAYNWMQFSVLFIGWELITWPTTQCPEEWSMGSPLHSHGHPTPACTLTSVKFPDLVGSYIRHCFSAVIRRQRKRSCNHSCPMINGKTSWFFFFISGENVSADLCVLQFILANTEMISYEISQQSRRDKRKTNCRLYSMKKKKSHDSS